jgi:hypothetical protein
MGDDVTKGMADALGFELIDDGDETTQDLNEEVDEDKNEENPGVGDKDEEKEDNQDAANEDDESKSDEEVSATDTSGKKVIPTTDAQDTTEKENVKATDEGTTTDSKESPFVNEQVAKIDEYIRKGGKLEDYIRTQAVDYTKVSDFDAIFESEKLKTPGMDAAKLRVLLEEEYGVPENATDRQKEVALAKMERDAVQARNSLVEYQKEWSVPKVTTAEVSEKAAAAQEQWVETLSGATEKVEKIDIKLNENSDFSFEVSPEERAKVKENYSQLNNFWKRYVDKDGNEDTEKFVKDMVILNNYEAIIRAAASKSKSDGKQDVVDGIKNPDFKAGDKGKEDSTGKSIEEQAMDEFFGIK